MSDVPYVRKRASSAVQWDLGPERMAHPLSLYLTYINRSIKSILRRYLTVIARLGAKLRPAIK